MKKITDGKKQNLGSLLTAWAKRRRLVSRLSALDDRMLDDIGYRRYQIQDVAERAFPRVGLKSIVAAFSAAIIGHFERVSAARQLAALDDRMLADIGLKRDEINKVVDRTCPPISFGDAVLAVLETLAESVRNREVARQLNAMDDRLLADMGLSRGDIALIIKGRYPRRPVPADATRNIHTAHDIVAEAANDKRPRLAA